MLLARRRPVSVSASLKERGSKRGQRADAPSFHPRGLRSERCGVGESSTLVPQRERPLYPMVPQRKRPPAARGSVVLPGPSTPAAVARWV